MVAAIEASVFWREYLDGAPPLLEVITDRHRTAAAARDATAGRTTRMLCAATTQRLRDIAAAAGVSAHTVHLCALGVLLGKYARTDEVVIGVVAGNPSASAFLNHVPIRVDLPAAKPEDATKDDEAAATLASIMAQAHDAKARTLAHAHVPWSTVCHQVGGEPSASYTPVFQVAFSAPDDSGPGPTGCEFHGRRCADSGRVDYDLELCLSEGYGEATLLYRTSVFDALTAERLLEHYDVLLRSLSTSEPARHKWYELAICSDEERGVVIEKVNLTSAPYPETRCIHDLFEDMAIEHPSRPCLIYHDSALQWHTLTYADVYARCSTVATQLRRLGVGPDVAVPIILDRSPLQIVAIYGVLLAGGCYVPIDADYPSDRVAHMLKDARAEILITDSTLLPSMPSSFTGTKLAIDVFATEPVDIPLVASRRRAEIQQSPDTNVYIFYTSGTTGLPKGVEVTHRGLVKRAQWLQDFYPLKKEDKMMYKTPFTFGISEWELFWPMPFGFQIVITKEGGQKDPDYLLNVMRSQVVTACTFVPSMLAMLLEYMVAEGLNYTTYMKHVICCGEALPVETCHKFFEVFDPEECRMHNLYGPTEADMTYWECPKLHPGRDVALDKVPIGKPMLNVKVYILDAWGQPVPAGVPGELYFGGVTTARGYLNLPKLTAEKFVPNPFRKIGDTERMYRTGDCARWKPDLSTLEFIGRVDNQVKLRGFRIELGEIESVIGSCDGVTKVAVIVDGKGATARIVAYVEPATISTQVLVATLKAKVPEYMVPAVIVPLASLPVTARGKLDRKALPKPPKAVELRADKDEEVFTPATTASEKVVESVWQRVLGRTDPICINANFLSLGGNSLLAGRVTTQVRKETSSTIPSTAMYQHPTIAKIAALCDKHKGDAQAGSKGPIVGGNKYRRWGGESSTSMKAMIFHVFGFLLDAFTSTAIFLPGYLYVYDVYSEMGKWVAVCVVPLVLAFTMMFVALYTITLKTLLLGTPNPGEYPVWGSLYLRWWLIGNLHKSTVKLIFPFVGETSIYNAYLRAMGATIGARVTIGTDDIFDPYLVTIGDDCVIGRKATIIPQGIENGVLSLWPVRIEDHVRVHPVAWVTQGSRVPAGSEVGPISTTGMSARDIRVGSRSWRGVSAAQDAARVLLIAFILAMEAATLVPFITALEWLWATGLGHLSDEGNTKYAVFLLLLPWAERIIRAETFYWLVVAYKWTAIGKFKAGRADTSFGYALRTWFLDRITHHSQYRFATMPYINTELLAMKYRMLGVQMGWKCQTDYVEVLEFDLLTVGHDCVFGSNVTVCPSDYLESRPVIMQDSTQVLDHSTLMPGCVVGKHALCGSSTLGAKFHKFPPLSISTGNERGRAVQLRILEGDPGSTASLAHLPPAERDMAQQALEYHRNDCRWASFNLFNILAVMAIAPLSALPDLMALWLWLKIDGYGLDSIGVFASDSGSYALALLICPPIYMVVHAAELLLLVAIKWIIVGRYAEGNYPFYGSYHRKWVIMMSLKEALGSALDELAGTVFYTWFFRAMGARVGSDACIFGYGLEYDLFSAGDQTCIGAKCDLTCHTVENMVIKLAPTQLAAKCTMRSGALVQPGGVVQDGAVIVENSQVLKGGEVGEDQVYAGLPAEPCRRVLPELASPYAMSDDVGTKPPASRPSRARPYLLMIAFLMGFWALQGPSSSDIMSYVENVRVQTTGGTVSGEVFHDALGAPVGRLYAGIPYAAPPVGDKRFTAPTPAAPWSGMRLSSRRPACTDGTGEGDEDCLYLDVAAPPRVRGEAPRLHPTIVWFPGGCGTWARSEFHSGENVLRSMKDVVVVTPSFRVGAMGFLHSPAVSATQGTTNLGLLDQRMVLLWVKENIKAFGGDPNNVILFGQSSAALWPVAHLVAKRSWPLFHKVIIQSLPAAGIVARTERAAAAQASEVAVALCAQEKAAAEEAGSPEVLLKCLREKAAGDVFAAGAAAYPCKEGREGCAGVAFGTCGERPCAYGLAIDGREIVDHPWRLLETGQHAKVPVLLGYLPEDGERALALSGHPADTAPASDWREWAEEVFHPIPERDVTENYPASSYDGRHTKRSPSLQAALAARTDQLYGCIARRIAAALPNQAFLFTRTSVYQGVDSHLWFHSGAPKGRKASVLDRAILAQVQSYWGSFMRQGDPGTGADVDAQQTTWEAYGVSEQTLFLQIPALVEASGITDTCKALWDPHFFETMTCLANV